MDPATPADRRARAASAKIGERDEKQTVEVVFHPEVEKDVDPADSGDAVAPRPEPGGKAEAAAVPEAPRD